MELVPLVDMNGAQPQVPKAADDFAKGIVAIVKVVEQQLADGFQPGSDLPAVAIEVVKDLPALVAGVRELKEDVDYDKGKVLLAVVNALDAIL